MEHFMYGGSDGIKLEYSFVTVLRGHGKFQDNDGEIQEIDAIYLPTSPSGKHLSVLDKEDSNVSEWRSYDDGEISSFECTGVDHWDVQR